MMISKVFIPLTLLAAVSAGLLPYQAPIQAVQHAPIEHVPVHHIPVQHVPIQEQVYVQKVHAPAPTREIVSVQRTILKEIEVPYPVDRYVKVDRHVRVPVDRFIRIDRPYEVIKYIQEPYIVRVERPYHVAFETKVPVPKPIVEVEPIFSEPQHIVKEEVHHEEAPQQITQEPKNDYLPPPPQPQNEYLPPQQTEPTIQPQSDYLPPQQSEQKSQFVPPPPPPQQQQQQQPQSEYLPPRH